jgi:hypothetical protein
MRSYVMQIILEVEAEDEDDAMEQMIMHLQKSNKLEVDIFDATSSEYLLTGVIVKGDTNESGRIH